MSVLQEKRNFITGAITILVALLALGAYLFYMPLSQPVLPTTTLSIGSANIEAELATTPAEQEQGLSGRVSLPAGRGMFFVFDHADKWGIWMKDMRFPLDILWADENGYIVTIEHEVPPSSYPNSFYPSAPSLYVLEVPAGFAKTFGIAIGQQIVVK